MINSFDHALTDQSAKGRKTENGAFLLISVFISLLSRGNAVESSFTLSSKEFICGVSEIDPSGRVQTNLSYHISSLMATWRPVFDLCNYI